MCLPCSLLSVCFSLYGGLYTDRRQHGLMIINGTFHAPPPQRLHLIGVLGLDLFLSQRLFLPIRMTHQGTYFVIHAPLPRSNTSFPHLNHLLIQKPPLIGLTPLVHDSPSSPAQSVKKDSNARRGLQDLENPRHPFLQANY
ncbi:hypothetical protein K402DRAFT_98399 [Aulographum hederae CBS 113979]|uniref:Uncharacterized protein n=1 Tax=Aulographum hederae CBS 113979 TaxID=1176131 RepID=A0A6G1GZ62_9PEZI|nr:hypothetical protein K402DRAFT_98399 [Aulographum hederae CBS 113979]